MINKYEYMYLARFPGDILSRGRFSEGKDFRGGGGASYTTIPVHH